MGLPPDSPTTFGTYCHHTAAPWHGTQPLATIVAYLHFADALTPAAASQATERGSSAGPFIQSPHVSDASVVYKYPAQGLHIFTRGGSIHSHGLCCSLTSEFSGGHLLRHSARLPSLTHTCLKRCADLPVDAGGLQASYQREGACLVPPRPLNRPPRPNIMS